MNIGAVRLDDAAVTASDAVYAAAEALNEASRAATEHGLLVKVSKRAQDWASYDHVSVDVVAAVPSAAARRSFESGVAKIANRNAIAARPAEPGPDGCP